MKKYKVIRVLSNGQRFTELNDLSLERANKEAQRANKAKEPNTRYLVIPQ